MNIIKQLKDSNGNNIYPIGYAQGGMKMNLLWTNPSPTASFAAQTINLDLSSYDFVMVCFRTFQLSTDADLGTLNAFGFKEEKNIAQIGGSASGNVGRRFFTPSDTGIEFSDCRYNNATNNNYTLPTKIYGIKMSYVVPTSVHGLQYVEV